jgi:hypothetical protein
LRARRSRVGYDTGGGKTEADAEAAQERTAADGTPGHDIVVSEGEQLS